MCGIAGFTGFSDNRGLAVKAGARQAHRGPDNQSVWSDSYIAFAHQRLSIIDLSESANQPLIKDEFLIVFNGEIYNYKELQDKLRKERNVSFVTNSDTELILELYKEYGKTALDELIGMFAFAIYNKNTNSLFIARDHFGIKPLYYTVVNGGFGFSSELKALIDIPGFDKTIDEVALAGCLNYNWVPGNRSMFRGCHKLPPAHFLMLEPGKEPVLERYWKLDINATTGKIPETDLVNIVAGELEASVTRHMVADVPVGSFLSGGLDSSLIAVLAKNHNPALSTYTIATTAADKKVEQMPEDEKYAAMLARQFGFDHHEIILQPDIINDFPRIVYALDEPIGDPSALNTLLICRAARAKGLKVLLSGMGADEVFSGYRRNKATMMAVNYRKLPASIRRFISWFVSLLPVRIGGRGVRLVRWAKRFLGFADKPLGESYMRSYSYYEPDDLRALLKAPYVPAVSKLTAEHSALFEAAYAGDAVNQMCYTDIHMFLLGLNLSVSDKASMAASVELRVPFIDRELINLAMKIPGKWKLRKGESKYILKRAAERYLPHDIIYRPKASFGAPIRSWMSGPLSGMVDELLSRENIEKRGFLNYEKVKSMIEEDRKGTVDYAYQIYQFCTLELWCRNYLDS